MKALVATAAGGPEVLRVIEKAEPRPQPGQVLIAVRLAGVNWADTTARRAIYAPKGGFNYPYALGLEAMGTVAELGPEVNGFHVGQRVAGFPTGGSFGELALVNSAWLYPIPDEVSDEQAAAFTVVGLTAYHVLVDAARARPGESILVTAAAGGVGTTALQIARRLGLGPAFAAAGTPDRAEYARTFGATAAIEYGEGDYVARMKQLTGGRGLDVAIDSVGGHVRRQAVQLLRPLGRLVEYGNASGEPELTYRGDELRSMVIGVMGFNLAVLRERSPEKVARAAAELLQWIGEGEVTIQVDDVLPLGSAEEAHLRLEKRQVRGKLLLRILD